MDSEPSPGNSQETGKIQKPENPLKTEGTPGRFAQLRSIRDTLLRRNKQPSQDTQTISSTPTRGEEVPINADSPVNAVWRNAEHDAPVRVTGSLGPGPDGREYVSVEGSASGIPRDEIDFGTQTNLNAREDLSTANKPSGSRLKRFSKAAGQAISRATGAYREARMDQSLNRTPRDADQTVEASTSESIPDNSQLAFAIEGLQGTPATPEQVEAVNKGIRSRLTKLKIFGQPLTDFLVGAASGTAARQVARMGLAFGGLGGLPAFAAIGAAGGGISGGTREYLHQRREIKQKDSEQLAQIRSRLKRELHTLKAADKKRLGKAALRGSAYGAVGGVIGATIIDSIIHSEQVQNVAGKAASYIRDNAPTAGGFLKDRAAQGAGFAKEKAPIVGDFIRDRAAEATGAVKDKAGPKVEAIVNWAEPVTKPIQEKAGLKIEAIGDTVGPIARDIQQRTERAYEAFTQSPKPVAGVKVEVPESAPEIKAPPTTTPESPAPPVLPKLPHSLESVNLESGSNPWNKVNGYLAENLGRQPTNREIQEAVARVLADNNITDATKIPAGTTLKLSGVNEYLNEIASGRQLLTPELAISPDTISLPAGSNPWNEVSKYLEDSLGRPPTNAEVLEVTKGVARASDIKVPVWGIDGHNLDTQLQPGFKLNFNDEVKAQIQKISDKGPEISASKPSIDVTPTSPIRPVSPDITSTPTPAPNEVAAVSEAVNPTIIDAASFNPVDKISLTGNLNSLEGIQEYMRGYLQQALDRKATGPELAKAIATLFSDNQITDTENLPVDTEIKLTGVNNLIQNISKTKAA